MSYISSNNITSAIYATTLNTVASGSILKSNGSGTAWAPVPPFFSISNNSGKELVRITDEGKVIWGEGIEIDEAAEKLTSVISLSAETKAGITKRVKIDLRNSVFEEIIELSKLKNGNLSTEDLTFAYESSKIIEKLKGV
jgi:hypothetical protein